MKNGTLIVKAAICILLLLAGERLIAQKKPILEIDQPMPDFLLPEVQYYDKSSVALADFKGKWLVLDFWNRYCYACLVSHPKMDTLRKKFTNKNVEVILVGYTGSQYRNVSDNIATRELYERNRKANHLSIPIAYDSVIMEKYGIKPTPYIIIVAPNGLIKAITTRITQSELDRLITGDTVSLKKAYLAGERRKFEQDYADQNTYRLYNEKNVKLIRHRSRT